METLTMPPEIAAATVDVCTKVKMAVKEHVNKHGGYKYVSVDTFYEDMGPLLAESGLILMMNEANAVSDGKWLTITFHIYIYHKSGKSFGPVVRSQGVMANGPQAYAAAQSFAEKYFIRQVFKVPTGDADADEGGQGKAPIPKSPTLVAPAMMSEAESGEATDKMIAELQTVTTRDDLLAWTKKHSEAKNRLIPEDAEFVKTKFNEAQTALKTGKAA